MANCAANSFLWALVSDLYMGGMKKLEYPRVSHDDIEAKLKKLLPKYVRIRGYAFADIQVTDCNVNNVDSVIVTLRGVFRWGYRRHLLPLLPSPPCGKILTEKGGEIMDQLDAITLLYLSRKWDGNGSLLDCAHIFQQTKAELTEALNQEQGEKISRNIDSGASLF